MEQNNCINCVKANEMLFQVSVNITKKSQTLYKSSCAGADILRKLPNILFTFGYHRVNKRKERQENIAVQPKLTTCQPIPQCLDK